MLNADAIRAAAPYALAIAALVALVAAPGMSPAAQQATDALLGAALVAIDPTGLRKPPGGPQS